MKLSTTYAALLLAASSKLASAKLGFEPMLTSYNAGDNMAIDYWTDSDYSAIVMDLVMKTDDGWEQYDVVYSSDYSTQGNQTMIWHVREVLQGRQYAIWMTGQDGGTSPMGGKTTGYAALSDWFEILPPPPKPILSREKMAGGAIAGVAFCVLGAAGLFAILRRCLAKRKQRYVLLPQHVYQDELNDSDTAEKERVRMAMAHASA